MVLYFYVSNNFQEKGKLHLLMHTQRRYPTLSKQPPNLVCLLCRGGVSLCVLVRLQQQVHQSWNSTCLPQWCLVGWAQSQVPDQTNSGLKRGQRSNSFHDFHPGQMWVSFKGNFTCSASKWQCQLLFGISVKYIDCIHVYQPVCDASYQRKPQG